MKPLIKWPGGKSREIKNIDGLIPQDFDRYIEPFVGGGALFFHLEHRNNAINDINQDLMQFYLLVQKQDEAFLDSLNQIAEDWELLKDLITPFLDPFLELKKRNLETGVPPTLGDLEKVHLREGILEVQSLDLPSSLSPFLINSFRSKIIRISQLESKHGRPMTDRWTYRDHVETAIRAAYYTMLRDAPPQNLHPIAVFFFIREFAFGSMFRYNSRGKFNIPYGGIAYNRKSFRTKVELLQSPKTVKLLSQTTIHNSDYLKFIEKVKPTSEDFVFFDPPYDSDFTEYGQTPFGKSNHLDLVHAFAKLESKALMVIGNSQFITKVYERAKQINPNISIRKYPKKYAYNVRGRNDRGATHLVITNYSE
ncbi:MAG: hypothetical protein D6732_07090 [Methanobacteriota archaeon]|nr:MAG: hypothetical protein D6732_07090 [Euryarchaeota archaeon]